MVVYCIADFLGLNVVGRGDLIRFAWPRLQLRERNTGQE